MKHALATAASAVTLTACAAMGSSASLAPEPAKPVNATLFTGLWHEVARSPEAITKDCVAGQTRFFRDNRNRLIDRDSCRKGGLRGEEKVFSGPVTFLDDKTKAKFRVDYEMFGPIKVTREYWILDHGTDWFIVSSPNLENLAIFTRGPQLSRGKMLDLLRRARAFGYDTAKLEYPPQPPVGRPARV